MRAKINRHEGIVQANPETYEDLWTLSRIITEKSIVSSRSNRKYKPPGSNKEERISVYTTLDAEKIELHKHSNSLRVTGKILDIRPEFIAPLNSYHTIEINVGDEIKIKKDWRGYEYDILKESIESSNRPIVNILLVDYDMATFASLKQYGIEFGVEVQNSGKKVEKEKEMIGFFNEIISVIENQIPNDSIILLGGPGFVKENLQKYLQKENNSIFKRIKIVNASNAEKSGVYELVKSEEIKKVLENEKIHSIMGDMEKFLKCASTTGKMCAYGLENIELAVKNSAVEKLIVVDSLLRTNDKIEDLIKKVKAQGGEISFVPEETSLAEQVKSFGGIIALLRFAVN
jgi:protein pelota